MTRRFAGAAISCLVLLAGLWLVLAPFALGLQPKGTDWSNETLTDVWSGIGLAVIGLIAAVAFAAGLLRHLTERGLIAPRPSHRATPAAAAGAPQGADTASVSPESDLDTLLAPLVAALAHDLGRERENGTDLATSHETHHTAEHNTADHNTANQHTANQHTANQHTANQHTANQHTGAESPRYSANSAAPTAPDQPRETSR